MHAEGVVSDECGGGVYKRDLSQVMCQGFAEVGRRYGTSYTVDRGCQLTFLGILYPLKGRGRRIFYPFPQQPNSGEKNECYCGGPYLIEPNIVGKNGEIYTGRFLFIP